MSLNVPQLWTTDLESGKGSEVSTRAPSPLPEPPELHHDLFHLHDPHPEDSSTDHLQNLLHPNYHHDDPHHFSHHSEKPHPSAITISAFPHLPGRHPVKSQRQLFLLACTTALTIGLGLGAAVGVWKTIHISAERATHFERPHLAAWPPGILMGFVLSPFFETVARAFFAKVTGVLTNPAPPPLARGQGFFSARAAYHRLVTHLLTVSASIVGLSPVRAVMMQYGPTRGVLGVEFPTFVVGFTLFGFVKLMMEVMYWDCEVEVERRGEGASWGVWAKGVAREIGALYTGPTVLTVLVRDALTFATWPYIGVEWIGYFKHVADPEEHFLWVPRGAEIPFFFSLFCAYKEATAVLAALLFGAK